MLLRKMSQKDTRTTRAIKKLAIADSWEVHIV